MHQIFNATVDEQNLFSQNEKPTRHLAVIRDKKTVTGGRITERGRDARTGERMPTRYHSAADDAFVFRGRVALFDRGSDSF
jgi:hypothetical protein